MKKKWPSNSSQVPLKVYENVIIGNFLYGLGFSVGQTKSDQPIPSCINLLQQTPSDKLLADVLLEFPGVVRLIEFKAEGNASDKELLKNIKLKSAVNSDLSKISRSIHWYVETKVKDGRLVARVVPYLDAFRSEVDYLPNGLDLFVSNTANSIVEEEKHISEEFCRNYLSLVARCNGPGKVGTGGLLLVANGKGGIRFAHLLDIMQLRLQHRDFVKEVQKEAVGEVMQEQTLQREHTHSLGMEI